MTLEPPSLPVFIVTGTNWTAQVNLDEHNAQFELETQTHEAACRAVEAFKGKRTGVEIVMNPDSRNENPKMGTILLVHLKDTDPNKCAKIYTHICLADMGEYVESAKMQNLFIEQVAALKRRNEQSAAALEREKKLAEDLADFDKLKDEGNQKP